MLGRPSGVGQYGLRLLAALSEGGPTLGLKEIGVFDGRDVVAVEPFLAGACGSRGMARHEGLRRLVRRAWPSSRDWADRWRRRRLARQTKRARWSLFHETNYVSPACELPLVTTVHDMGYLRHPEFVPRDRLGWLRRRMGTALARSRVILAVSHFTRRELLELCPEIEPERVVVTEEGVDLDFFSHPAHASRLDEVRRRFLLPDRFVLYLGTLEPRKNLQGLIAAYRLLPGALQREYPLVLAGMSGWNQEYFRRSLDELRRRGVVHEIGYVAQADVPVLMQAATVFCFPSIYEGFGLPPLEAAACGTPVLASRTASLPEVLGPAAVYVDPFSPADIAAGLRRLLEDEKLQGSLRAAGPARAAMFSWENCARQTAAAYRAAA